jgi:hypothetical protein
MAQDYEESWGLALALYGACQEASNEVALEGKENNQGYDHRDEGSGC